LVFGIFLSNEKICRRTIAKLELSLDMEKRTTKRNGESNFFDRIYSNGKKESHWTYIGCSESTKIMDMATNDNAFKHVSFLLALAPSYEIVVTLVF